MGPSEFSVAHAVDVVAVGVAENIAGKSTWPLATDAQSSLCTLPCVFGCGYMFLVLALV